MRFESDAGADEGVAAVNMLFSRELRWIFREVSTRDVGVDAQVEVCRGRLIKAGESYFAESIADGWIDRGNPDHLEYLLTRRPHSWSCTTRGTDLDRRVGTDREQLLLAVELVPEAPQLTAWGSDADVQSAAIGELVRPVCGLGFANLDIGQHRRPPKYPA